MIRDAMNDLIKWKDSSHRKPLIIRGARQVGKTWLMREFGRTHYEKYAYITLYPLNFLEFINATGNDSLVELLKSKDFEMITSFKGKYIDALKQYYYIGGMPEVVAGFAISSDFTAAREVQKKRLIAYEQDKKYKGSSDMLEPLFCWVLVQRFCKAKYCHIFTRISSYDTHNLVYKLNLRQSRLNFFNLPFSYHMHFCP